MTGAITVSGGRQVFLLECFVASRFLVRGDEMCWSDVTASFSCHTPHCLSTDARTCCSAPGPPIQCTVKMRKR